MGTVPTLSDIGDFTNAGNAINPVIQSLLASKPWGALPPANGNVTFTTPFSNNSDNLIVKADQHANLFSPGDLLTGRYSIATVCRASRWACFTPAAARLDTTRPRPRT